MDAVRRLTARDVRQAMARLGQGWGVSGLARTRVYGNCVVSLTPGCEGVGVVSEGTGGNPGGGGGLGNSRWTTCLTGGRITGA